MIVLFSHFSLYASPKVLIVPNGFHRTALDSGGYKKAFLRFFILDEMKSMKLIGRYAASRTGLLSLYFLIEISFFNLVRGSFEPEISEIVSPVLHHLGSAI